MSARSSSRVGASVQTIAEREKRTNGDARTGRGGSGTLSTIGDTQHTEADEKPAWSIGGRNYVLVLLTAVAAINFLDRQILGVLLEPIREEFGLADWVLGLLTGNMLVQYPGLFGAVVVQVPLLDMRRYHKLLAGASWMAEYGNPDKPEEWDYIRRFSPYHLFDPAKDYPPVLFTTSTRDDRVHPGHARKMMALMQAADKDVRYYENIEGGHGGAADNRQSAHMNALAYTFLWQQLSGDE